MSQPEIVDAVKVETPNTVTVPLKLDASALADALKNYAAGHAAGQQPVTVRPGRVLSEAGAKMEQLAARVEALQRLGVLIQNLPAAAPLPAALKIESIEIKYSVATETNATQPSTVVVHNVVCVGDIMKLLQMELGTLVLQMHHEAAEAQNVSTWAVDTYKKAMATWSANNPDRQIRKPGDTNEPASV